ncbi:MAG TPA: hypothetical protein VMU87_01805 [Stellaceae bacterium]|nr:hypothetical protein [Stellaceae bacterium]
MGEDVTIADARLAFLHQYWRGKKQGRSMPSPVDIDPAELPAVIQPNVMVLDVVGAADGPRFRYRRVGGVFWRAGGTDLAGRFVAEVLPVKAGYRDYVVGIYREMAETKRPMYTENVFILQHGQVDPMSTKRVSLPLSYDGTRVDGVLAAHVFDYGGAGGDDGFILVTAIKEDVRAFLD